MSVSTDGFWCFRQISKEGSLAQCSSSCIALAGAEQVPPKLLAVFKKLVAFHLENVYASENSHARNHTAKTLRLLQPYFRLSELHQCDQGMQPNRFS